MSTKRLAERDGEVADGAVAFLVDKPIKDLVHLDALLTAEHGWRKASGIVVEGDLAEASKDSPAVVWALRDDTDTDAFKRAVSGYADEDADRLALANDPLAELRAKAQSGEDFTAEETQDLLRKLLLRSI